MARYYYNTKTGQVEKGRKFSWFSRMGPYATAEEAQQALEIAQARTQAWDEEDKEFRDED
ncbi:SPOR domain-containing protein [Jonesiaceae bacterium BS-20]|uniref:SPOR domain-containing protein n=1 Tax=Jonesiaceae bacterium BS-20 TaxID=3120821 RepID=A0AAU7DRB7_9MICO